MKFGIAPYFVELLNSQLKDVEYFLALFDESFNSVSKKTKTNGLAYSILGFKYYSSEFLGKSSANDT